MSEHNWVDLTKIDGIGPVAAQVIISEVGKDMSRWPSEKHFASWLGVCPDHRISGGAGIGARDATGGEPGAQRTCGCVPPRWSTVRVWLGAKYRRLKSRLGAPKAIVAMAHH